MMSRICYSAESEQQYITASIPLPENREFSGIKIRTDASAPQRGLHLVPSFLEVKQISEHFLRPSIRERPSSYFPVAIELMPSLEKWAGFETLFHYRIGFDTSMDPWLSPDIDLLRKIKGRALSEQEAVRLMSALADRASEHYDLRRGEFVAITFSGKIVDVADTKIDLLKKVQGKRYSEQIFVWEVGSESFTGWKR